VTILRRAGYLQTCLLTKPEFTEVETPPVQPELAPTLVLPLNFVTPPAQQEQVLSQQRGASPFATRGTTLRSGSRQLSRLRHELFGISQQAHWLSSASQVEDRPIVKEQITYVREHHPMEKEFIVETRPTGRERELTEGRTSEVLNLHLVAVAADGLRLSFAVLGFLIWHFLLHFQVINTEEKIIEVTPRDPCAGVEPVGGHIGRTGNY